MAPSLCLPTPAPKYGNPNPHRRCCSFVHTTTTHAAQAITGNPGDIIGPILSPHQAYETWQGKLAAVLAGGEAPQEGAGRPWWTVDVRDVAEAEIQLAESIPVSGNGQRFMLVSGDRVPPRWLGPEPWPQP